MGYACRHIAQDRRDAQKMVLPFFLICIRGSPGSYSISNIDRQRHKHGGKDAVRHPGARNGMSSGVDDMLASTVLSTTCSTDSTVLPEVPYTI